MNRAMLTALLIGLVAGIGLSGCGKKGSLERPAYAEPAAKAGPDGKKPHRSFVLDGLI